MKTRWRKRTHAFMLSSTILIIFGCFGCTVTSNYDPNAQQKGGISEKVEGPKPKAKLANLQYANKQRGLSSGLPVTPEQLDFASASGATRNGYNPPNAPGDKSPIAGVKGDPALSSHAPGWASQNSS